MVVFETILSAAKGDLDTALEALYPAFAVYAAPDAMRGSPVRDLNAILASLRSAPLRELSVGDLEYYAATALTTVGSPEDFKHFLPRILHFSAVAAAQYGFDPEIVASKLLLCDWHVWPVAERTAVANLFYSAWALARLQHTDMQIRSWNWIRAMATIDLQFEACLDLWIRLPIGHAMLQLAEGGQEIKVLQRGNGLWAEVPVERRQIILDWMAGEAVEAALINAVDLLLPAIAGRSSACWTISTNYAGPVLRQKPISRISPDMGKAGEVTSPASLFSGGPGREGRDRISIKRTGSRWR